jgi:hypothetical protein
MGTALAVLAASLVSHWPYVPLEDPVSPWAQVLEASGLLEPAGVYPIEAVSTRSQGAGYLGGPLVSLMLRSAPPGRTIFAESGSSIDLQGGLAAEVIGADPVRTRSGAWVFATGFIRGSLGFNERLSIWQGSDEEPPEGFPSYHMGTEKGRHFYVDRGYLEARRGSLGLSIGRIPQRWGPGRFTSLLLSDNPPALDMIRFRWWQPSCVVSFNGFTASIDSDSGIYLTAHRLDYRPSARLRLGLSEAVLFESEGLDLAYMNPIIPYYPVQWNERDDDNAFVCLDFTTVPLDGFAAWGELLVDDFQYQEEYHRPNKLGLTLGAGFADPGSPVDATLEYTRIDRYVYSQKLARNYYLHDGRIIGSELGPDADRMTLSLVSPVLWPLSAELRASHRRSGEGTVYEGYPDSVTAGPFPSGIVENATEVGMRLSWLLPSGFEAFASASHVWTTNAGHVRGSDEEASEASASLRWTW